MLFRSSAHIPVNSAMMLDTSHIDVLDRQSVSVLVSVHHDDNFIRNRATILAELRAGLEVRDVNAVRIVESFGTDWALPVT